MKKKDKRDPVADDRKRNDQLNKSEKGRDEKNLPGNYPPNEDMMNRRDTEKIALDGDNFSRNIGIENFNKSNEPVVTRRNVVRSEPDTGGIEDVEEPVNREMERPVPKDMDEDEIDPTTRNESDVTDEDMQALGPKDLSMDGGEDEEILKNRVWPVDMAGGDLDVPGAELDDANESIGSEDEENNSYSLGGDRHEDNLEGK